MMAEQIISKSKMAFELPNKKGIFILDELDVKEIASKLWAEILVSNPERCFMLHDTGLSRAKQLYEVYQKEKDQMNEEMKQDCLKSIIKFLSENDFELTTLKQKIEENSKK